ncbi:MAG: hypothetical protein K0Q49_1260 [Haloplasmataceae bacterium]|jgi:gas vesicle protein|nr:hypothetical protein [Haloplasmataceae bacterium]
MNYVYIALGIILIIAVIILTVVIVRFFEHYRQTLQRADLAVRVAETSFQELDNVVTLISNKIDESEHFFLELSKTGKHLEVVNNKISDVLKLAEKYPSGLFTSLLMLNKIDTIKELPKIFNLLNFDEELNSMLKDFIKGAVVGGLAVALLTPKTGEEMRKIATQKLDELTEKAKNINVEEVRNSIFDKIEELRNYVKTSSKDEIINRIFEEIKNLYDKIKDYLSFKDEPKTEIIEKQ